MRTARFEICPWNLRGTHPQLIAPKGAKNATSVTDVAPCHARRTRHPGPSAVSLPECASPNADSEAQLTKREQDPAFPMSRSKKRRRGFLTRAALHRKRDSERHGAVATSRSRPGSDTPALVPRHAR